MVEPPRALQVRQQPERGALMRNQLFQLVRKVHAEVERDDAALGSAKDGGALEPQVCNDRGDVACRLHGAEYRSDLVAAGREVGDAVAPPVERRYCVR